MLVELVKRKPPMLAAVALANKMARVVWKLMVSGERYNPAHRRAKTAARISSRETVAMTTSNS